MIIVECYSDIALVQCLTSLPREYLIHQIRGKSGVCRQVSERVNCKGLIDEDPKAAQHPYEKIGISDDSYYKYDIKHVIYPEQRNELVILCPKLEDWFIKTAQITSVDVTKHGLSDDPDKLHRTIDQKLNEFRILLNMLKKQKSERILVLTKLLEIDVCD